MELFKNSVGRPSNEIKKKRRNFAIAITLVCVMTVGGLSYLAINKKLNLNGLKDEDYVITPTLEQIADAFNNCYTVLIKKFNRKILVIF